jgi:hypothetical protein
MGGLFGGTTTTTSKSEPWAPQGDAIKGAISGATDIYNQQKGTAAYSGDLYANMDPATRAAIEKMQGFNAAGGQDNVNNIGAAGSSLTDIAGLKGAIGGYQASANADPTQANITNAGAYANNPYLDRQIDAASRDVTRNLYENDMPSIDRAATSTGNINSSRAGIATGIAARGAQDQIGDIGATMRGNAFNNGLSMAESARTSNLAAQGNVASLYGQKVNAGLGATATSDAMAQGHNAADITASQLYQQDAQGQLDADKATWDANDTRQNDLLARYYSVIGANNWGGTQTNTQKTSGNIFGQILGGVSSLAGLGVFGGGKK